MDNIDGIPIIWDDADKLFGSLFPDGVAQGTQGFAEVQRNAQSPQYVSPFMEMNNIEAGANLITNDATSQFPYTGTDQDGNAGYEYLVATIPCDDGAKVYSSYESAAIEPHEMHLFYEKEAANKNNLFGNFYIAKIGDSFTGIIKNFLDSNNANSIPGTIKGETKATPINSYDTLTTYVSKVAQKQHLHHLNFNATHNAIEREYLSKTPIGKLYEGLNSIDEIIAKGLDWCADGLDGLMIQEKSYKPLDNYTPIIGQSKNSIGAKNLVSNLFEDAVNSPFAKEVEAAIGEAYSYIVSTLTNLGKAIYDQLPESVKNVIRKLQQLVQELKTGLDTILQYVGDFIKAVGSLVLEVLQLINAFLCGIINGIISTVQVIIRILAFLVDMAGMDNDYKSYLRRRDFGEKIESVFDFITESFSSMVNGILNLFAPPYNTTVADIKRFIKSIGSFFENVADGVEDFFANTSRFKFAYWAGIFVFEVIINVLLVIFTAGGGNAVKAAGSFVKILGREMISVATLGVVDILAFFKSLIGAFVRACKKGLKGFLRWVEELIKGIKKGNAKSVDELLEDAERAIGMAENLKTTINVEEFLASAKRLENIKPEEALKYLDEALVHFNHEVVDGVVVQISDTNCAVVVQRVDDYLRTGKISIAEASKTWELSKLENVYDKTFLTITIPSLKKIMQKAEKGIVFGYRGPNKMGHVFNVIEIKGELKFVDGQSATIPNLDIYLSFKYFKTPKL